MSKTIQIERCPNNLHLTQNLSNQNENFNAENNLKAQNQLSGTSKVIYGAGKSIVLEPGFVANSGTTFTAKIQTCL